MWKSVIPSRARAERAHLIEQGERARIIGGESTNTKYGSECELIGAQRKMWLRGSAHEKTQLVAGGKARAPFDTAARVRA